ncbi:hypothetical protein [Mycoplasma procyoni]|uniref:hypothetical protein n=1 Tax=Mycoplasma procyoni TaxID=568784 RepID=UPI00197C89B0|nr:hypothetical protein [Mycoplasma procyoni]MBN3534999.1 hypothetical protein [Mycoplasma procyoni]
MFCGCFFLNCPFHLFWSFTAQPSVVTNASTNKSACSAGCVSFEVALGCSVAEPVEPVSEPWFVSSVVVSFETGFAGCSVFDLFSGVSEAGFCCPEVGLLSCESEAGCPCESEFESCFWLDWFEFEESVPETSVFSEFLVSVPLFVLGFSVFAGSSFSSVSLVTEGSVFVSVSLLGFSVLSPGVLVSPSVLSCVSVVPWSTFASLLSVSFWSLFFVSESSLGGVCVLSFLSSEVEGFDSLVPAGSCTEVSPVVGGVPVFPSF